MPRRNQKAVFALFTLLDEVLDDVCEFGYVVVSFVVAVCYTGARSTAPGSRGVRTDRKATGAGRPA